MENINSLIALRKELLHSEISAKPEIEIQKIIKVGNSFDFYNYFCATSQFRYIKLDAICHTKCTSAEAYRFVSYALPFIKIIIILMMIISLSDFFIIISKYYLLQTL